MAFAARRDGTLSDLAEGEGSAVVTDAMCDVPERNVKSRNALVVGIIYALWNYPDMGCVACLTQGVN